MLCSILFKGAQEMQDFATKVALAKFIAGGSKDVVVQDYAPGEKGQVCMGVCGVWVCVEWVWVCGCVDSSEIVRHIRTRPVPYECNDWCTMRCMSHPNNHPWT